MGVNSPGIMDDDHRQDPKPVYEPVDLDAELGQQPWKSAGKARQQCSLIGLAKSWICTQTRRTPATVRPTAYLDGLRGFAALIVYFHHHQLWVHDRRNQNVVLENAFGYEGKYYLAAFPGIRLLFTGGHFAVSIFFVLSGYVLSIKPWQLVDAGDMVALGDHLASAFFRRWIRLFLPPIIVMVLYATSWHIFAFPPEDFHPQGSWRSEMWTLYAEFKNFSFLYRDGGIPWLSYNLHLWSIPVEMKGSMVLYASVVAFSRSTVKARVWCLVALAGYFLYIADGWYCAMFVAGMLLSYLDLLARTDRLPQILSQLQPYKTFIFCHLFAASLYLGGIPCENGDVAQLNRNRGWYYLSYLKPQAVFDYKWFYLFWAANFLVASVGHIRLIKRFFETRFCQYLGRVSFALYLVHGPVLSTVGNRLYHRIGLTAQDQQSSLPWAKKVTLSSAGPLGLEATLLLAQVVLLPATFCLADLVTRAFDTPSVRFSQWLYRKTLPSEREKRSKA
ncbi:acyltransferase [Purpureocillium lavendulum]|uniref:Acyltransferase n=1 Tax=Purpureocillium lavendulum TaxID=1247861 RepID=A0AB34FKJ0_9HYPO|nr:acyltransferase [Purpureocillium lavendulum]